jgi:hypothetical protein
MRHLLLCLALGCGSSSVPNITADRVSTSTPDPTAEPDPASVDAGPKAEPPKVGAPTFSEKECSGIEEVVFELQGKTVNEIALSVRVLARKGTLWTVAEFQVEDGRARFVCNGHDRVRLVTP